MDKKQLYDKILSFTESYFKNQALKEANITQGQSVRYNGKAATVIQIYQSPVTTQQDIKLPTDQSKYPVYVLKYNDTNLISVVSKDGVNNITPA